MVFGIFTIKVCLCLQTCKTTGGINIPTYSKISKALTEYYVDNLSKMFKNVNI